MQDRRWFSRLSRVACLCALTVAGCAHSQPERQVADVPPATPATPPAVVAGPPQFDRASNYLSTAGHVATGAKIDFGILRDDGEIVVQLDVYQMTVPYGGISADERFWSHVDEDHVNLATHGLLLSNGIRYGVASNDEWKFFKNLMDLNGATARKGSVAPVRHGMVELPMLTNIQSEDIFYINAQQKLYGRTYEKCDNILAVSFEPTPRRAGEARIELSALVRGIHKQYEVTLLNDTREIELKYPEYLYDLRLRQDVPFDHFLVIAPSREASLPDNLGHTFFVRPNGPAPVETVLIMVPRPFRVTPDATPASAKAPAAK